MKKRKGSEEHDHQAAFFKWLGNYPNIRDSAFAVPNGGSRHPAEAVKLRAEGVTSGIPDVMIGIPSNGYPGLFIEFKSKVGRVSYNQKAKLKRFAHNGYACHVCRSVDEGVRVTTEYLGDLREANSRLSHNEERDKNNG